MGGSLFNIREPPKAPPCVVELGKLPDYFLVKGPEELHVNRYRTHVITWYKASGKVYSIIYKLYEDDLAFNSFGVENDCGFDISDRSGVISKKTEDIQLFSAIYQTTFEILAERGIHRTQL